MATKKAPLTAGFSWTPQRQRAAYSLSDGATQDEAAAAAGVNPRTIREWLQAPEFAEEVDRLTLLTGIATRAERMRVIKRTVRALVGTEKDLLDWLKFAQSETTGAVNDLADRIADAITGDH